MTQHLLITGASGYLAHRLVPIAAGYGKVTGFARNAASVYRPATPVAIDLSDANATYQAILSTNPTAIIHAAAVNPGSGDPGLMEAINHQSSEIIAQAAKALNCRLVVVSSESVYRGDRAPYRDHDQPDPINAYGQSKAAGERGVLAIKPDAAIVRTSLIYGLEEIDRGTQGFQTRLQQGEPLVLFNDVLRQPIWADSLSHALCKLATGFSDVSGTLNVVGDEVLSRAEFGLRMLKHWQVDVGSEVRLRSGAALAGVQPDLRCLCHRAKALGFSLPGVTEVLAKHRAG